MLTTFKLSNRLFRHRLDYLTKGIFYSQRVSGIITKHLSSRPFHLNVIEASCRGKFKETGHSLVLADMLRHPKIQSSFLERFLGITQNYLDVTAETDRVDVALKGKNIFIIIENKVNAAEEQKNQVYRYVHEIGMEKYGYTLSQIYVIYLNPTNRNLPSDYSLCDENHENNVFDELGSEHYNVLSYKYDITNWLRNLSIENEPHIESALDQYIDFLENKFHTSSLDTIMNSEVKTFLLKELQIENKSLEEQISALSNQYEKTEELLNSIESLRNELRKKLSHEKMREWQRLLSQQLNIEFAEDEHSFGLQLNNKVWLGIWDGYDSSNHMPYWGFQCSNYRKEMPNLSDPIMKLLKKAGIDHFHTENKEWIAWCSTDRGVERYRALYYSAKEIGLL